MRMIKLKDVSQLEAFKDVVSLQVVDGNIEAVTLTLNGQALRIVSPDTYSRNIQLLMEEPKQETKHFRVVGTYMGMNTVPKVFDSEYDAKNYIVEMNGKLPYDEEHTLAVEEFSEFVEGTKI